MIIIQENLIRNYFNDVVDAKYLRISAETSEEEEITENEFNSLLASFPHTSMDLDCDATRFFLSEDKQ